MELGSIDGEALGVDFVLQFVEAVYDVMCTADRATYVLAAVDALVDQIATFDATRAELNRYRKIVSRASALVPRMETEAKIASELTPTLMQAAAFDPALDRVAEMLERAGRIIDRIASLWEQMIGTSVPIARRAAAFAVYGLAVASYSSAPTGALPRPADLERMFNGATGVFVADHRSIDRRDAVPTRSGRALLDALVGAVAHLRTQAPSQMTVYPVLRETRFVRVSALADGTAVVESVGSPGLTDGDRLTSAQKAALASMGFEAPSRRVRERNWRQVLPDVGLIEISVMVANVLEQVHGVAKGDRLAMHTLRCEASGDLGVLRAVRRPRAS